MCRGKMSSPRERLLGFFQQALPARASENLCLLSPQWSPWRVPYLVPRKWAVWKVAQYPSHATTQTPPSTGIPGSTGAGREPRAAAQPSSLQRAMSPRTMRAESTSPTSQRTTRLWWTLAISPGVTLGATSVVWALVAEACPLMWAWRSARVSTQAPWAPLAKWEGLISVAVGGLGLKKNFLRGKSVWHGVGKAVTFLSGGKDFS